MNTRINDFNYPYNLVADILRSEKESQREMLEDANIVPKYDFEPSIEYMLVTLKDPKQIKAITLRYENGLTYKEVGLQIGVGVERCRQIINKALSKLRHSSRLRYISSGGISGMVDEYDAKYLQIISPSVNGTPLHQVEMPARVHNALKRAGVDVLEDLSSWSIEDLARLRNLGKSSILELLDVLQKHDVELPYMSNYDRHWLYGEPITDEEIDDPDKCQFVYHKVIVDNKVRKPKDCALDCILTRSTATKLWTHNVKVIHDVLLQGFAKLKKMPGVGKQTLLELYKAMYAAGYVIPDMTVSDYNWIGVPLPNVKDE